MKKPKHVVFSFIRYSFHLYKPYYFALFLSSILTASTTILSAYTLSLLIQCMETKNFQQTLVVSLILVGIEIILGLLTSFCKYLLSTYQAKMEEVIDHAITNKVLSLPFQYLEDPYYMELRKDAAFGINNMGAIYMLFQSFADCLSSIISMIGLAAIIMSFDWLLMIVLLGGIILTTILIILSSKAQAHFFKSLLGINYRYGYYMNTLLSQTNCKDLRLYSTYDLLFDHFCEHGKQVSTDFQKIEIKMGFFESTLSFVRYVEMAIVYILVGLRVLTKHLPISSFTLTISSAIQFSDCVTKILSSGSTYIRSTLYIKPMMELLSIEEVSNAGETVLTEINEIRFEHVTFKYPNTEKIILDDVSFTFEKNQKISIVGLNGAGKTTIIKLLCRLYEPTSGVIYINDLPISRYERSSYMEKMSAVFQDYKLFAYSISENIRPGISLEEAEEVAKKVGMHDVIEDLPKKYESTLSKSYEEDGIELSGGQRQKIAIARSLAKNADLLILDEPTSALDPLAEAEIYQNFNELADHKMAIYISHRMSSSIFCDKILVIDGGKVSDFDTHDHLMQKKDSLYYQLFTTQAKNYELNE